MRAILLSLCLTAAPVPKHLFPPPPHPVQVGFEWYYGRDVLQVTHAEGDRVRYRCLTSPGWEMSGVDGYKEPNTQSRARCWDEALQHGVP